MQFVPGLIKSEACLFRLDAVRQVGGLDESLVYAMDLDLILRLRQQGPALRCKGASGRFCLHPGSLTIRNRMASFDEAQRVQRRSADALVKRALPVLQPLLLRLFMTAARRMEGRNAAPG
jgi:GT2 family glycosyltransferase